MKKTIIKILLVVVWMIVIFCFSNQVSDDSTRLSDGFIKNTICKVSKSDCDNTIEKTFTPVRKCAHFCVYLILGLLVMNCFNIEKKYIIYSLLICLLYSISDEIHQLFVSGRSGEVLDVFIDTCGSLLGISALYKFKSR
ncbi:MAG: VanZ family protein [Bacilli bacterium]|nr:VanZ family protein [Bacilli bacterium]